MVRTKHTSSEPSGGRTVYYCTVISKVLMTGNAAAVSKSCVTRVFELCSQELTQSFQVTWGLSISNVETIYSSTS